MIFHEEKDIDESKMKVLKEEVYLKYIKAIIDRDFFPFLQDDRENIKVEISLNSFLKHFNSDELEKLKEIMNVNNFPFLKDTITNLFIRSYDEKNVNICKSNLIKQNSEEEPILLGKKRNKFTIFENCSFPPNFLEKMENRYADIIKKEFIDHYNLINELQVNNEMDFLLSSNDKDALSYLSLSRDLFKEKQSKTNSFKLPKLSEREQIAHILIDKSVNRNSISKISDSSIRKSIILESIHHNSLNYRSNHRKKSGSSSFIQSISRINSLKSNKLKKEN